MTNKDIEELRERLKGEVLDDQSSLLQYATDASAYREVPLLVTRPKNGDDIRELISFAREHRLPLIPRTAGTSLAGQVVGKGIIADVSKHMTKIIEINPEERWVCVEPGVILDELNIALEKHGLFFGPETSTSSRCMIGGMLGNNACGAHSLIYGSTRDHTISAKVILSDGSEAVFEPLSKELFLSKCELNSLEGKIYKQINEILSDPANRNSIHKEYPDPAIKRRNTGY
ncbi:MAG: FAD-binding oxidoreductase, partial [Bacteroidales bacterium]|nr:FAD-binding oxidoreductase [Bacteroidales bacterium]